MILSFSLQIFGWAHIEQILCRGLNTESCFNPVLSFTYWIYIYVCLVWFGFMAYQPW